MKKLHSKKFLGLVVLLFAFVLTACSNESQASGAPETIRLDYAHYSPTSLVLQKSGWVEEEFADENIDIEWAFSQGSNKSLEYLNSDSIDFGSTAGAAALLSKANGAPIESVYVYSKPEWAALVTTPESGIQSIEDLPGKSVAATLGTDPYIFLLRALDHEGINPDEVEIVSQQHTDGATSLINGEVDAWAGLDPTMASVEVEADGELFYREPDFNTYGFLNVRNDFAEEYPEYVERIIALYERARGWAINNPEETIDLIAEESGLDREAAEIQYVRNDFSQPIPGSEHTDNLIEAGRVLQDSGEIDESVNVEELVNELINPNFSESVINEG